MPPSNPSNADLPETIGPYRIQATLGEGGMGRVYRAIQEPLGREVALKVLSARLDGREDFAKRFLLEARAMAGISHPNVVTCFDAGTHEDQLFMALELVGGGDAAGLVKDRGGRLSEAEALAIIRDAAAGLEAIEEADLIHRDIKPANIFITPKGVAKLADLGLARNQTSDAELTIPGTPLGTPAYMAPEQAMGQPLDIRCDVYAIGATLYALLTGRAPFMADNPMQTMMAVVNQPPPDPLANGARASMPTLRLIERCLAKAPADRPGSAHELVRALEDAQASVSSTETDGRAAEQQREAATERRRRAASDRQPAVVIQQAAGAADPPPAAHQAAAKHSAPAGDAPAAEQAPAAAAAPKQSAPPPQQAAAAANPAATPTMPSVETLANPPTEAEIHERLATSTPVKGLNPHAVASLVRRIHVSQDRLSAWINLAPGSSFPVKLLEVLLHCAGVVNGVQQGGLLEASRRTDLPRKMILARGTAPSPGMSGKDVYGNDLAASAAAVVIRISADDMQAHALFTPGELVPREAMEQAVRRSRIRFGIDKGAITRIWQGPPDPSGRVLVAEGTPPRHATAPGFHLSEGVAECSIGGGAPAELDPVAPGEVIAMWAGGEQPRDGMDVTGTPVQARSEEARNAEDLAGEGTEVGRANDGALVLSATRRGYVQQRAEGEIRVIGVTEVQGDLGPEDAAVESDEVVVVRGSVRAGAVIRSAEDVVIMGDLEDAHIEAGGDLVVEGDIGAGSAPVDVAGNVDVAGSVVRKVVAGNLRIGGTVRDCELLATGDIEVQQVIGGRLTAGGCVRAEYAGDQAGITTELHAGHHLAYQEQHRLARLGEKQIAAKRERMVAQVRELEAELGDSDKRQKRLAGAAFINHDAVSAQQAQLDRLRAKRDEAAAASEDARRKLAKQRKTINELGGLAANDNCAVEVHVKAHPGVVARIADADPIALKKVERRFRLDLDS